MKLLATDLDKTLLPNSGAKYDGTLPLFSRLSKKFVLAYVTGRNYEQVKKARKKYKIPDADFIITEVGTVILSKQRNQYEELQAWTDHLRKNTKRWNIKSFQAKLKGIRGMCLQEKENQNEFKLSYYVNNPECGEKLVKKIRKILNWYKGSIQIVCSEDIDREVGFVDILPRCAGKLCALSFVRKKCKVKFQDVLYSGDSGNDISLLSYMYNGVIVKNAAKDVIKQVKANNRHVYVAKGKYGLNGNYSSGVIEGMVHFGWISEKFA
tara:strand:+ start:425 stop:1222 length:798 start_codon:yes stop_codon:yes gene_type:complete